VAKSEKMSLAELNRAKSTLKVDEALNHLKKLKLPINIKSVSDQAGISRKTVYNRPDLRLKIEEAISLQNDIKQFKTAEKKIKSTVQSERIEKLREKNKQLVEDKKAILEQNRILTKENNMLKQRLHDLEEILQLQRNIKVAQMDNKNSFND
jgi:hypothetical protein